MQVSQNLGFEAGVPAGRLTDRRTETPAPAGEKEVNALVDVLYVDAVCVGAVPQDDLLQVEEGALVFRVLPHLGGQTDTGVTARMCFARRRTWKDIQIQESIPMCCSGA
jgi:hypothetical protein